MMNLWHAAVPRHRYRNTRRFVTRRADRTPLFALSCSSPILYRVPRSNNGRLTLLGRSDAKPPEHPDRARLETFPNPAPERDYWIHFETDDFTSLCPVTAQADFARIDIQYVPARLCVESKSLKFYLASFRNERAFNEAVTNRILDDFVGACAPREVIVTAQFSARGGIALTVRAESGARRAKRAASKKRR